jgi:SAM-dependent methyltransferase
MNIFENQLGFITRDPRATLSSDKQNSVGYTPEEQQARYEAWISPELLAGASILDLGCCTGAVGGYAFAHGAERYVGVEISRALAKLATENFEEYHPDKNYEIVITSAEDYLDTATEQFDFIIVSGILHGVTEITPFLSKIAQLGNTVIVESVHPPLKVFDDLIKKFLPDDNENLRKEMYKMCYYVELLLPFAVYSDHGRMIMEDSQGAVTNILRPLVSIGALGMIFNRLGFEGTSDVYGNLIRALPKYFGYGKRFGIAFKRRGEAKPMSFSELFESSEKETTAWKDIDTKGTI